MNDADWSVQSARTLGMYLSGEGIRTRGPRGERITDRSFLLLLHAGEDDVDFRLPGPPWAASYRILLDTTHERPPVDGAELGTVAAGASLVVGPHSFLVLAATR